MTVPRTSDTELLAALRRVTVSLIAAVSLLECGGKKAAPSDRVFEQMLKDYRASVEVGRALFEAPMSDPQATEAKPWERETCPVCGGAAAYGCQAVTTEEQSAGCPYNFETGSDMP